MFLQEPDLFLAFPRAGSGVDGRFSVMASVERLHGVLKTSIFMSGPAAWERGGRGRNFCPGVTSALPQQRRVIYFFVWNKKATGNL